MGKYLYNGVMKRWLYGPDINDTSAGYKSSAVFQDGYDDPTYMTFKVEFGDWGASVLPRAVLQMGTTEFRPTMADYDALPIGLLNCPYPGGPDTETYWQSDADTNYNTFNNTTMYSAFQYLRSRNEDTRAKYLFYFVNGLFEIQKEYPFVFKKISGLAELEKMDPVAGQRLKTPVNLTLECYDGLDLKIKTLMELYRKAAWDDVYQRWILPENMRQFKMIVYVFERRTFHDTQMFTTSVYGTPQKNMLMSYSNLNGDIPVKAYECIPCEFDINNSQSWKNEYSAAWDGPEESSKIGITVKNVKTYFKNDLLKDELSRIYDNDGKKPESLNNNLTQRINSIMIYDLVDSLERTTSVGNTEDYDEETSDSALFNLTVNGAKAMFLNKNILLENEDANQAIRNYIWGNSVAGPVTDMDQYDNYSSFLEYAHSQEFQVFIEDSERTSWIYTLVNGPTYNPEQNFWQNLGNNVMNVLAGARKLILMSGAANITYIPNCLIDTEYIEPRMFNPIDRYDNGLGHLKMDEVKLESRNVINPDFISVDTSTRTIPKSEYPELEYRNIPEHEFNELEPERDIPAYNFNELDPERQIPEHEFSKLEPERQIPKQQFSELTSRDIPEHQFNNLEPERQIPEQQFSELDTVREIVDIQARELDPERNVPEQQYKKLEKERDIPKHDFAEIEPEREIKKQQYRELDDVRDLPEQQYRELDKARVPDDQLMELLLVARSLPGLRDMTLEDVRKIPVQDLIELEKAERNSIPIANANKSVLLDAVRNIEGTNDTLVEMDKDNRTAEEKTLEMLKKNSALANYRPIENNKESTVDEKAQKLRSILEFTKEFTQNSDKVKTAYIESILAMKSTLRDVTVDIINKLPINDTYIVKKGEKDNNNINSALISENDIHQINHNMKFLAINDSDVRQLSFQSLIQIHNEIEEAVKTSKAVVGLTQIVKNSVATNPSKEFKENANKSVLEEPRKKTTIIY